MHWIMNINRVFIIVLDSAGIGALPDAAKFGDAGSNTFATLAHSGKLEIPNMAKLGFYNIDSVHYAPPADQPAGCYARLGERSQGKDTTVGHWEIAGVLSEQPLPTFPTGFPAALIDRFSALTGRGVLCNKPYSGTKVLEDYGAQHVKTGDLIVYTSADSVFQVAAHELLVPPKELYRYCEQAREILHGEWGVGRVIARPFIGEAPNFTRTSNRHDFSLQPPANTMLDYLKAAGLDVIGVGKISDIFAGCGLTRSTGVNQNNDDGMHKTLTLQKEDFHGLCFVNLVDFDMLYGHRNNIEGYTTAMNAFDRQLGEFLAEMHEDDLLMITADHGCDPGYPTTDHTREYVPLLVAGAKIRAGGVNMGTRASFADIAATVQELFGLPVRTAGESFASLL